MHIQTMRIQNFRRLKDVRIDLASDISILVGANNSGKTSASQAMQLFFAGSRERFSVHDFSAECWAQIDAFGDEAENASLPKISIDLWFHVDEADLHRVIDLLPSLNWEGSLVGLRVEFAAQDQTKLLANFKEARAKAYGQRRENEHGQTTYHPPPRTLMEYLKDHLRREFEMHYFVLDYTRFNDSFTALEGYSPQQLMSDKDRGGKEIFNSLLRVDFLSAQRHLSDGSGGSRAEDLSRCLSRFYERNLEKRGDDHDAMHALAESESQLNDHLARVFEPTLARLSHLGYPGLANPRLVIKSALNPATLMGSHDGAKVHYALGGGDGAVEAPTLPDRYNGLGFKNLIYMVVELLDLHTRWLDEEGERPPLHLVFIEEPEAHLHTQLQQVFIRKIIDILAIEGDDAAYNHSQLVVSTHSPHILFERGFRPIRYFRRCTSAAGQYSEVLNLSEFYQRTENPTRDFLERYVKLTHCDLFFADAAVLVEGNVERLLLPQMIETVAPRLKSAYVSILEIGGAFGHCFRSLIEFLGITTLIITDIDSVNGAAATLPEGTEEVNEEEDDTGNRPGTACMVHAPNAVTSNQTLIQWLPRKSTIANLLAATPDERTQPKTSQCLSVIHVTYQTMTEVTWGQDVSMLGGRTLEEAFAFENLEWCQHADRAPLRLRIRGNSALTLQQLAERIHKRVKGSSFNKTDFALGLLTHKPGEWLVPAYIQSGLMWLENQVTPPVSAADPPAAHSSEGAAS